MSTNMERLTAAIGRRLRAITARFGRPVTSYPAVYGVSSEQDDSPHGMSGPKKPDESANATPSSQAWLPIGPSCC